MSEYAKYDKLTQQLFKLNPADRETLRELLSLMELDARRTSPAQLKALRSAAGLSVGQAASLLGMTRWELSVVEAGDESYRVNEELGLVMNNIYGLANGGAT